MQLTYRGISYTPDASILERDDANLTGQSHNSMVQLGTYKVKIPQSVITLQYRGVFYLRGR